MAYDLTAFVDAHPAGNWLVQLGLGRDCTALFESYHLRPEVRAWFRITLSLRNVPQPATLCRRASQVTVQCWARGWAWHVEHCPGRCSDG